MAINVFIKIDGPAIIGGSTNKGHEGEIEVLSWNHGFNQPTQAVRSAAGSGTVETANHQHFTFSKYMDEATDDLCKMCWSGKHIDKVTMTCYRSVGDTGTQQNAVPYFKIEMENVIVSDYTLGGGVGDLPTEQVALNYAKLTYTYTPTEHGTGKAKGAQVISHDLKSNVVA